MAQRGIGGASIGREACGRFFELLLEVVPEFSTQLIESTGGGTTVDDGATYDQRCLSQITDRHGLAFRTREWCNPFETYQAFGEERSKKRTAEIMATHDVPWPDSQAKP